MMALGLGLGNVCDFKNLIWTLIPYSLHTDTNLWFIRDPLQRRARSLGNFDLPAVII